DKRPPAIATRGGSAIDEELGRWTQYLSHRWMEAALLGVGVVTGATRMIRLRKLDPVFGGLVAAIVVFTVLVSSKTELYMILFFVDFYVWERIRRERNVSWAQFLDEIRPQYVILDSKAKSDVVRTNTRYLEENADLVASFRHVSYTRVEVWKLRGAAR